MKSLIVLLVLQLIPVSGKTAGIKEYDFFTFSFENDYFVAEDDGYTNGMGISFGHGPFKAFNSDNTPGWLYGLIKDLYINTAPDKLRGITHSFYQVMQTPDDLSRIDPILDDVPYVGHLGWRCSLNAWDKQIADQVSISLGFVGPVSMAKGTQKIVHRVFGSDTPRGWGNQIDNEAVFNFEAQRIWMLYRSTDNGFEYDILGMAKAGIGTIESAARTSIAIRWGNNIMTGFPTFSLNADRQVNPLSISKKNDYYFFLGIGVGIILNDIAINGNTYKDSHSLPLQKFSNQLSGGLAWSTGDQLSFVFQVSTISSPTTISDKRENYGALSVTYSY